MRFLPLLAFPLALAAACEPEIGSPCDPDTDLVEELVQPKPGTNNLVQNVKLDNCKSQSLCASVNGSRGFCTVRCEGDLECAGAGEGFKCLQVIDFGPLACRDFTKETDCLTEEDPDTGAPAFSEQPLLYCSLDAATANATLDQRDADFGRAK
jgi:hypothetical protein